MSTTVAHAALSPVHECFVTDKPACQAVSYQIICGMFSMIHGMQSITDTSLKTFGSLCSKQEVFLITDTSLKTFGSLCSTQEVFLMLTQRIAYNTYCTCNVRQLLLMKENIKVSSCPWKKRGFGKHSTLRISLPSSWSSSPTWVTEKSTIVIFALSSGEKCGLGKRVVQYSLKPSVKVTYRIKKITEGSVYLADSSMGHALACIRVE